MLGVAGFFGVVLAIANRYLKVEEDPRIDRVEEMLPGSNCGACGQPGCRGFAEAVIDEWGLNGMIIYKFALITLFILICEVVGTLRDPAGRMLSRISLLIAAVPVVWSLILLSGVSPAS